MSIEERLLRIPADVDSPVIVAVACFAGDISAPSELVSALPADCGLAFIFVEQPSAGRASLLAEALMKGTTLPVVRADDDCRVEHGRIYLVPQNVALTMAHGRMHATPATRAEIDCSADNLFISIAQESGDKAIGVILSGGGSDRALGIRAIKQAGGTTFAQYPGSARFPNLPISAIDTGCVDFVLRPNEIAHELTRISRQEGKSPRGAIKQTQITQPERILTRPAPALGLA
jgi:two-component system, chemotaxis family, CheB/CheR fusion protein